MKYKALLIEDELPARVTLKSFIKRYFDSIHVVSELGTIKEAISFLDKNYVDIIFLDIQLKDGNGIKVLDQIDTSNYKIIFTTAHDEFTLDAFKHKAFGYLLKPLDPSDFKEIVNRILKDLKPNDTDELAKRIKIPISYGHKWIDIETIIRCQSESNYTKIIVNDNSTYILSKTLKHVQNKLIDSKLFCRVHQSHLINLTCIKDTQIIRNQVTLINGDKIPVSRTHKDTLSQIMKKGKIR